MLIICTDNNIDFASQHNVDPTNSASGNMLKNVVKEIEWARSRAQEDAYIEIPLFVLNHYSTILQLYFQQYIHAIDLANQYFKCLLVRPLFISVIVGKYPPRRYLHHLHILSAWLRHCADGLRSESTLHTDVTDNAYHTGEIDFIFSNWDANIPPICYSIFSIRN